MSEWVESTVGGVTLYQRAGGTPTATTDSFYGGDIPFVTIEDITNGTRFLDRTEKNLSEAGLANSAAWLIKEPHILYSMYATVGKPIINQIACATNQAIIALKESLEIEQSFLFYQLLFIRPNVYKYTSQTTQSNLNAGSVKKLPISYPKDKREQRKIATILTGIDTAIEKTEALIAKYQQIKAGLMHDLFTRGVLPSGELRATRGDEPGLYRETSIGWLPRDWQVVELGELADIVSGITLGAKEDPGETIDAPYLRVANVQDGYLDLADVKTVRISPKTLESLRLLPGDVLMNEGGDFDKLGRGAVWAGEIPDCVHQNHVFRVRTNSSSLLPDFLAFHSQSAFGKKYFVLSSKQSTNLASINSKQLHAYPIALPGASEQKAIVVRVHSVNRRLETLHRQSHKLNQQKLGLMQDLLTGKVSVKVDEPVAETADA